MRTWVGRQFWGDVYFSPGLRIQESVWKSQYRLLTDRNHSLARGSYESCLAALQQKQTEASPRADSAVVLIHGILRTANCFHPLQQHLQQAGFDAYCMNYPSTQITIEQAAHQLERVLQSLRSYSQVHLVGHSMGGLVIRRWFGVYRDQPGTVPIGRVMMVGTPNQGAHLADWLRHFPPFWMLFGKAGLELGANSPLPPQSLPIPTVPFGIVAGGRGETTRGFNPLLPGDNDGTVTVASTQLTEACEFHRIPCIHRFLMKHPTTIQAVLEFLRE